MKTERTKRIFQAVQAGQTYDEIAQSLALSPERIRQLYKQHVDHDPKQDKAAAIRRRDMSFVRMMANRGLSLASKGKVSEAARVFKHLASRVSEYDTTAWPVPKSKRRQAKPNWWNRWEKRTSPESLLKIKKLSGDKRPVEILNVARLTNLEHFQTIDDVIRCFEDLPKYKGIGGKSLDQICEALDRLM